VKGDLKSVQANMTRMKLAVSKDENGHGLLHKAVFHGHRDIVEWLIEKYPETLDVRDWVSHLHYPHIYMIYLLLNLYNVSKIYSFKLIRSWHSAWL